MKRILLIYVYLLLLMGSFNSYSQILFDLVPKQNAVSLSNGINRFQPFTTVSYARGVHINVFNLLKDDVTLFLDFSERTNFRNDNAFRIIYGGQGNIFQIRSFHFIFRKTFGITWYRFPHAIKATFVGAEFELMPGFYKKKYFIALDLYYGDNLRGRLTNTGDTEDLLKDVGKGWFKPDLATFRTGINLGYHFSDHWTAYGNIDFFVARPKNSESFYPITPLLYGYAGLNYIFHVTKQEVVKHE
ncbi:MAG: hypothetical protein H7329_02475 [Opitutaceae bacterium]|nr:hypothetical protein [Cytophagales bacterium]